MMRAIIQLVDIYTMPNHSIYLIDEIENSMGIRSLPVMIDILFKFSKKIQFVFTTHHAYIFNNIDVGYWRILTREGVHIKVAHGDKLKEKFSKSYQEAYIQLLNSLSYKIITFGRRSITPDVTTDVLNYIRLRSKVFSEKYI